MSEGLKFLGSVCEASSRTALAGVTDELFTDIETPAVEYIRSFVTRHGEFPARQTVASETGLVLPAPRQNISFYEDALRTRHVFNQVRDRLAELQPAFRSRDMDAMVTAVAGMHEAARQHRGRERDVLNIAEAGELVIARLAQTRYMGGLTGALSGWEGFDRITGGFQPSDIITQVARPGVGKTFTVLKQAHYSHRHDGQSVLFVTTEMGIEPIARRYASIELGLSPDMVKRSMLSTYAERRLHAMYREMAGAERFRVFSVGMDSKVSAIAALCHEFRPSILYIDGVYLLQPSSVAKNAPRHERITYVFDELKGLNLEMNIPFVVTTQFNRAAGKGGKEGSLETIGYTDAIGTHSSVIIGLKEGPTDNPRNSRTWDFLKGREGEQGQVHFNFRFAPLDMSEILFNAETGQPDTGDGSQGIDQTWMV